MHSSDISLYLGLLNEARNRIATDEHEFICCAISDVASERGLDYYGAETDYLRDKVEEAIYPSPTMDDWAINKGLPHSYEDMKKMRLVFLDKWIVQTEKDLIKAKKKEAR